MTPHRPTPLTQKRLKDLLHYDPETGIFTWVKSNSNVVCVGDVAGCRHHTGYNHIGVDGKVYNASRLAYLYMEGYLPEHEVDHKDRDRTNDRWSNLRHISHCCNSKNRGVFKNNSSGVTGVYLHKQFKKWCAGIRVNGRQLHLGVFKDKAAAVMARWEAEKTHKFNSCQNQSSAYSYLIKKGLI